MSTITIRVLLICLTSPILLVALIILHPLEYPTWRLYKKEGYNVPGYLKFWWYRIKGSEL